MGVSVKAELQFITRKLCRCYSSVTETVILFLKFFSLPPPINCLYLLLLFLKASPLWLHWMEHSVKLIWLLKYH